MALEVSPEFGLVALVVVATCLANMYMAKGVINARTKYGIYYPKMYALESENKDAKIFNCVQRGHQNFLELVPFFLALVIVVGLQHPRVATGASILFLAARIVYFNDYSSGVPKKRLRGAILGFAGLATLMLCSIYFTVAEFFF